MGDEVFNVVKLARTKGFGPVAFYTAMGKYGSVANIIKNFGNFNKKLTLATDEIVEKEIRECEKIGAKIITCQDKDYPKYLKHVPYSPMVLSCLGNVKLLNHNKPLAMIGSRKCSVNSFKFAQKIAKEITEYGYIIVSGLAMGIDAASHIGSLKAGTIAVMGNGIDKIYPNVNIQLHREILKNDGLIVSEFPLHTEPIGDNFLMRNRIIAGISRAVVVINAGEKSGTLSTVRYAGEIGREIMVFPGNPYDETCFGSNKLLQSGANMVLNARDINEYLEMMVFRYDEDKMQLNTNIRREYDVNEVKNNDLNKKNKESNNLEDIILSKLDFTPIDVGELMGYIDGFSINEINSMIMKMIVANKVVVDGSRKISLALE
jgi:DNA processing protein